MKRQAQSTKFQAPNIRETSNSKLQIHADWRRQPFSTAAKRLLDVGAWNLALTNQVIPSKTIGNEFNLTSWRTILTFPYGSFARLFETRQRSAPARPGNHPRTGPRTPGQK